MMFQEFLLYMLQHYSIRDSIKKKHQIIEALTYQTHYVNLKTRQSLRVFIGEGNYVVYWTVTQREVTVPLAHSNPSLPPTCPLLAVYG